MNNLENAMDIILDSCALQAPTEPPTSLEVAEDVRALSTIRGNARGGELTLWRGINIWIEGRLAPDTVRGAVNAYWNGIEFKLLPQEIGFRGIRVPSATSEDYERNLERYERRLQEVLGRIGDAASQDYAHLVNAEYFGIPYFVTTDYKLMRSLRQSSVKLKVRVLRPVEFLTELHEGA